MTLSSCTVGRMPMLYNCSRNGKNGLWVEVDSSTNKRLPTYSVSRYKNGLRHGRHHAYRGQLGGMMWREEAGRYRRGKKTGLWIYYTTYGYYLNWVYYIGGKEWHNGSYIESIHMLGPCPCDEDRR